MTITNVCNSTHLLTKIVAFAVVFLSYNATILFATAFMVTPSLPLVPSTTNTVQQRRATTTSTVLYSDEDDNDAPSDYDASDLSPEEQPVSVVLDDTAGGDDSIVVIRDELKRELLLLASTTNRGLYATVDEKNILVDLLTQLEALNPTVDPANQCIGEWDLCLTTCPQAFRSSPFFQSIRALFDKDVAETAFDLHDKATSVGQVGRVREVISTDDTITSLVDISVGVMSGMPFRLKGTVVTKAKVMEVDTATWNIQVESTSIEKSNIPLINEILNNNPTISLPIGSILEQTRGSIPTFEMKTYYVDEGIRITRDVDDNFYVFSRS